MRGHLAGQTRALPLHLGSDTIAGAILRPCSHPSVLSSPPPHPRRLPQRAEGSDALPGQPREGQPPERARRPAVQVGPPQRSAD